LVEPLDRLDDAEMLARGRHASLSPRQPLERAVDDLAGRLIDRPGRRTADVRMVDHAGQMKLAPLEIRLQPLDPILLRVPALAREGELLDVEEDLVALHPFLDHLDAGFHAVTLVAEADRLHHRLPAP